MKKPTDLQAYGRRLREATKRNATEKRLKTRDERSGGKLSRGKWAESVQDGLSIEGQKHLRLLDQGFDESVRVYLRRGEPILVQHEDGTASEGEILKIGSPGFMCCLFGGQLPPVHFYGSWEELSRNGCCRAYVKPKPEFATSKIITLARFPLHAKFKRQEEQRLRQQKIDTEQRWRALLHELSSVPTPQNFTAELEENIRYNLENLLALPLNTTPTSSPNAPQSTQDNPPNHHHPQALASLLRKVQLGEEFLHGQLERATVEDDGDEE